ncbi:alpha/beta hydrolase [Antrihabitans sp. YC2-6]|uniref:alpha/beta hydrolase n=1 Tax=Antrihabitans sp. YC2-6 TaxID=2799498 RepID=UPI0018F63AD1|nr:alpha/beta hydrolase [Antrihabitans sp. YC2-6]MBJ8345848.1 alpha/beta hydrolase [Antrihabitans sp. YC2-6]
MIASDVGNSGMRNPRIVYRSGGSVRSRIAVAPMRVARAVGEVWPMSPWTLTILDLCGSGVGRLLARTPVEKLDANGVTAVRVRAKSVTQPRQTILYVHGGGFTFGTPDMYRAAAVRLSAATNSDVLLFDYRHPPFAPVASMTADCDTVYRWAVSQYPTDRLILMGDSAGGNLAVGMLIRARAEGLPQPAGLAILSAWLDLTYRHSKGAQRDAFFALRYARRAAALCSDGNGPLPEVRPLDFDLAGLPPTLIQIGSTEPLVPGNRELAGGLARAGVPVELQLWKDQVHVFQLFLSFLPESRSALKEIARFIEHATRREAKLTG